MGYIDSLNKLTNSFRALPGVGFKTAQRYAYSVLNMEEEDVKTFADSLINAKQKIKFCSECGNFSESEVCESCLKNNAEIICVVAEPKDVLAMEKIKNFNGAYHVLHGCINPLEHKGPDDIRIKELIKRVQKYKTKEVIMATNPDVAGDTTAYYIAELLKPFGVKVTRLAQGVAMGTDLEYADEVTLSRAMELRNNL
ncbi:MAG: recombination protein RecR [Clostridiales bacterium]|nr:recombination protein RecR [Clostridiales bacterium]